MNETSKSGKKIVAGVLLLVVVLIVVGAIVISKTRPSASSVASSSANQGSSSSSDKTVYKDGTYSSTGSYSSPGGAESIKLTITLASNTVTASEVDSGANDPTASSYQSIFIGSYKQYVVGKKVSSIHLSNVSGSSLTSQGFNSALSKIENQAKA
jgi:uncharacterized protein with FMN-binding domain